MLSTSAVMLICPECGRQTKMLGQTDRCMFCRTMLTQDPEKATAFPEEEEDDMPAASTDAADSTPKQT